MRTSTVQPPTLNLQLNAGHRPIWGTKQAVHYARDHSVEDALRQMGWLQGAIWSNAHVRGAVAAQQQRQTGEFPKEGLQKSAQ